MITKTLSIGSNRSVPRVENSSSIMPRSRQLSQLPIDHNKFINSASMNNQSSLLRDTIPSDSSEQIMSRDDSKDDTLTNSWLKSQSLETSTLFFN